MAEEQGILTRAARQKAGIPPPTPLFRHATIKLERKQLSPTTSPDNKLPTRPSSSSSSDEAVNNSATTLTKKKRRARVLWVQCDNRSCRKWRTFSPNTHIDETQFWYCHMHPDTAQNSCSIPEEKFDVSRKRRFTFSRLEAGQLVWAKIAGFCPWPAMVSPDPWTESTASHVCEEREGRIYHVEFLGREHTHNWLVEDKVEPYYGSGCKPQLGALKSSKALLNAQEEADMLLSLAPSLRLEKCVFQKNNDDVTIISRSDGGAVKKSTLQKKRGSKKTAKPAKSDQKSSQLTSATCPPAVGSSQHACTSARTGRVETADKVHSAVKPKMVAGKPSPASHTRGSSSTVSSGVEASIQFLLQSLGIPVRIDTVKKCMQAVATTSIVTATPIRTSPNPLAPTTTNKSTVIPLIKHSSQGPRQSRAPRSQSKPPSLGHHTQSHAECVGGSTLQHSQTVVVPSTAGLRQSSLQPSLSQPPADSITKTIRGRGRGSSRRGSKRSNSRKETNAKHISPSITDYFQPTTSPTPTHLEVRSEFHKLADEAESELREMEDMLALLPPPPSPPPSAAVSSAVLTTPQSKAVDSSIASVMNEMSEIEGLLRDLDGAQLVPYIN